MSTSTSIDTVKTGRTFGPIKDDPWCKILQDSTNRLTWAIDIADLGGSPCADEEMGSLVSPSPVLKTIFASEACQMGPNVFDPSHELAAATYGTRPEPSVALSSAPLPAKAEQGQQEDTTAMTEVDIEPDIGDAENFLILDDSESSFSALPTPVYGPPSPQPSLLSATSPRSSSPSPIPSCRLQRRGGIGHGSSSSLRSMRFRIGEGSVSHSHSRGPSLASVHAIRAREVSSSEPATPILFSFPREQGHLHRRAQSTTTTLTMTNDYAGFPGERSTGHDIYALGHRRQTSASTATSSQTFNSASTASIRCSNERILWAKQAFALPYPSANVMSDAPQLESSVLSLLKPPQMLSAHLSWLSHTIVELSIDQEGFRAIKAIFRMKGFSNHGAGQATLTSGTVDFMPIKRLMYNFHHSYMGTPPVLRRVTLNGDEAKDYISREAILSIKSNGVYAVHGSEILHDAGQGPQPTLGWKFTYVVDDRCVNGKVVAGEKTLVPLSFSCTPGLVHINQGKKTGLMRVLMKGIVPKLASEKVEPPKEPHKASTSSGSDSGPTTPNSWIGQSRSYWDVKTAGFATMNGVVARSSMRPKPVRKRSASVNEGNWPPTTIDGSMRNSEDGPRKGVTQLMAATQEKNLVDLPRGLTHPLEKNIRSRAELTDMLSQPSCFHMNEFGMIDNSLGIIDAGLGPPTHHSRGKKGSQRKLSLTESSRLGKKTQRPSTARV
jgi:hypothetical protein